MGAVTRHIYWWMESGTGALRRYEVAAEAFGLIDLEVGTPLTAFVGTAM